MQFIGDNKQIWKDNDLKSSLKLRKEMFQMIIHHSGVVHTLRQLVYVTES